MRRTPLLILTFLLGACGDRAYFEGAICPAADEVAMFADGDDLKLQIVFEDCLPGCGGNTFTECDVVRDGDTIEIDARGSYDKKGGNGACAAVCRPLIATCVIGGLDVGTYTINSGTHSLRLTLPSDDLPELESLCDSADDS